MIYKSIIIPALYVLHILFVQIWSSKVADWCFKRAGKLITGVNDLDIRPLI